MQKDASKTLATLIAAVTDYADREGAGVTPWPTAIDGLSLFRSRQPTDGSGRTIAAGRTPPEIENAMARLFALTDRPEAAAILAPLIKREIHYWLLTAEHGSMVRLLARSESHASRIADAIALIRRDITAPLKVAALAETAGMSPSSFHAHFKAITEMAPLQFQKQLRLLEARRLIYGGALSVSETAFAVGYESPTQFSRDYSRRFGVSPSRDAAPASPTTIAAE